MQNSSDGALSPLVLASGLFGLSALAGGGVYLRSLWLAQAGNRIVARLKQRGVIMGAGGGQGNCRRRKGFCLESSCVEEDDLVPSSVVPSSEVCVQCPPFCLHDAS
jgi:hypothetical protein